jgi:predicted ATPase/class 3 adenylate cyclase
MTHGGDARGDLGARRTVALLMTDVAASSGLWREHPDAMGASMPAHHRLVEGVVARLGGALPPDQGEGDSRLAVFDTATAAVRAALDLQRLLVVEPWPDGIAVRVRMGVHVGEVLVHERNVFGETVNRCARVRGLASGGQTLLSEATYELVRDQLPPDAYVIDLGEHRMRDVPRPERLHQLCHPALPEHFPPLPSLGVVRHNLGTPLSTFIGRDRELDELEQTLAESRLVTVAGPGGVGKTRTALHLAHRLLDGRYPDGVFFVDLAPLADPALVATTVAEAIGVWDTQGVGGESALASYLRERRMLLVLDNFEHVVAAAPWVARLLAAASHLSLLVTSRQPLRVTGEREYQLGSLSSPDAPGPRDPSRVDTYDAVRLFIDRARSAVPDFSVSNESAPAIAAICARLDGLPLAIELAAARVTVFSPQRLLERLEQSLGVLTGGGRDLPARHQTLNAAIAWSVDTLTESERTLLARLAAFRGGADVAAVEAVCGPGLDADPLDALLALVDRSLVRRGRSTSDEPRFMLLETVRQYAETLCDDDAARAVRDRHAAYWLARSEEWSRAGAAAYADFQRERDNLRAALDHLHEVGAHDDELLLAADQAVWWGDIGSYDEALEVLDQVVRENPRGEARAHALFVMADIGRFRGTVDARALLAAASEEAAALGLVPLVVAADLTAVSLEMDLGSPAAEAAVEEARRRLADAPAQPGRWFDRDTATWYVESFAGLRQTRRAAWAEAEARLAVADAVAGTRLTANARAATGWVRYELGDDASATALLEDALAVSREQGMLMNTAAAELYLGLLDVERSDTDAVTDRADRLAGLDADRGYRRACANAALLHALAAAESDRWDDVLEVLRPLGERPFSHWPWVVAVWALGVHAMAMTGDHVAARGRLDGGVPVPVGADGEALVQALAAVVASAAGDTEKAAAAMAAARAAPPSGHRLLRRLTLRLLEASTG